jgi:hypothetical protein
MEFLHANDGILWVDDAGEVQRLRDGDRAILVTSEGSHLFMWDGRDGLNDHEFGVFCDAEEIILQDIKFRLPLSLASAEDGARFPTILDIVPNSDKWTREWRIVIDNPRSLIIYPNEIDPKAWEAPDDDAATD